MSTTRKKTRRKAPKTNPKPKADPPKGSARAGGCEHPLTPEGVADAKLLGGYIAMRQQAIGELTAQARREALELHDEARDGWARLAERHGIELTDDQVVGITDDGLRLRVVSKEQAMREIEARRKGGA